MSKAEYLGQLKQRLKTLPPGELNDALDYYDGYLSDADDEAAAIAHLGTPAEVASQILAAYVTKQSYSDAAAPKSIGIKTFWGVMLVLISPVALPLACAAILLVAALFLVILAIGLSGIAAAAAGMVGLVTVPFVFPQHFGYALTNLGVGLAGVGAGILLIDAAKTLWRGGVKSLLKFVSGKISKGGK